VYVRTRIERSSALAHLVRSALSRDLPRTGLEDELVKISLEREEVVADRFDGLVREAHLLDLPDRLPAPELFRRVADLLGPAVNLSPDAVHDLLCKREEQASTVIHEGVAIPHVIVPGSGVFHLVLARCRNGADFPGAREPVHVLFVLAGSPDERNFHLRALMAIAHVVQSPGFLARWKAAHRTEQLRDIVLLSRRLRDSAPKP
jgi:APA family basic amino acid/polyamine antiporter